MSVLMLSPLIQTVVRPARPNRRGLQVLRDCQSGIEQGKAFGKACFPAGNRKMVSSCDLAFIEQ